MPDSDAMSTQESEPAARPATHPAELTRACQRLAERRTSEPDADTTAHTQKVLADFIRLGLLTAPFPVQWAAWDSESSRVHTFRFCDS